MAAGHSIASSVKLRQRTCVNRDADVASGPASSVDEAGGAASTSGSSSGLALNSATVVAGTANASSTNPVSATASAASAAAAAAAAASATDSIDSDEAPSAAAAAAAPSAAASAIKRKVVNVWSPEEKSVFFDALKLYGKNFMEIGRYMRLKVRRTADASAKSRNQVKVFYQRTWQSIRHFLTFDDAVRPAVRELYGLINYGHFRKYLAGKKLNARLGERLNELVHNGACRIKVRGKKKSFIVRSPVCPALRRLNQIQGPRPEYQFPDTVLLDLVPRTGLSYARVQAGGQNPRVRAKVSLNRQLFDALDALRLKWRTAADRLREGLGLPPRRDRPCLTAFLPDDEEDCFDRSGLEDGDDVDEDGACGFVGAELVTSVSKSKVKDIALEAYLTKFSQKPDIKSEHQEQQQQQRPDGGDGQVVAPSSSASSAITAEQVSQFRLDLHHLLGRLRHGVSLEESRGIRLLALYLALGCPTVIRLEYEYLTMADLAQRETGITNTMRRLFHLAAHELTQQRERAMLESENANLRAKIESLQAQTAALRDQVRELQRAQKQQLQQQQQQQLQQQQQHQQQQQQQSRESYLCCRCFSAASGSQLDVAAIVAAAATSATLSLPAATTTASSIVTTASGSASSAIPAAKQQSGSGGLQLPSTTQQQQQQQQQQFQVPQPCSTSRLQMRQVSLLAGKRSISAVQRQLHMGSSDQSAAMPAPSLYHLQQQQQQQQQFNQSTVYDPAPAASASADDSLTGLLEDLNPTASASNQQHPQPDDDNANFAALPASSAGGNVTPSWEQAVAGMIGSGGIGGAGGGLGAVGYSVSPLKTPQRVCESSRDSFTMNSAINALITEDTAEYADKFAQLMHEINDPGK